MSEFQPLWDRLLAIGGGTIIFTYEEDYAKLMKRGEAFTGECVRTPPKRFVNPNQCHRNSAAYYEFKQKYPTSKHSIVTGWALTGSEWVQHTWVYDRRLKVVWETTPVKRDAYFGYILTADEADVFIFDNE